VSAPIAWVCALVVTPVLALRLGKLKEESTGCYVFAGTRGVMKGKKICFRARMFERIERLTGIKLRPKDLRDYLLGEIVPKTDPITSMHTMLHSSLIMTPVYGRVVIERMKGAVKDLGKFAQSIVYDFERNVAQNWPNDARKVATPMEYFRIHAKRWLFWAVVGIGLIIALGLGCQITDSILTQASASWTALTLKLANKKGGNNAWNFSKD
jgi:hypothetical protein